MSSDAESPRESLRCTHCGHASLSVAPCERCGGPMSVGAIDTAVQPHRLLAVGSWTTAGGVAGALAAVPLVWWLARAFGMTLNYAQFLLVGAVVGATLLSSIGRGVVRRTSAWRVRASIRRRSLSSIASAERGVVRIAGDVRVVRAVTSERGKPCATYERHRVGEDGSVRVDGSAGTFDVDDGSGTIARVRTSHVVLLDGVADGDEFRVPDGARVEIVARARRVAGDDSPAAGPPNRSSHDIVELFGTADDPVVVRMTGRSAGRRSTLPDQEDRRPDQNASATSTSSIEPRSTGAR